MKISNLFYKLLWIFSLVIVLILALLPVELLASPVFNWWDKAQHALAFAVLTLLGWMAFPAQPMRVAVGMVFYGIFIELAQWAVGWRFAEWQDAVADCVGILAVWLGARFGRQLKMRLKE